MVSVRIPTKSILSSLRTSVRGIRTLPVALVVATLLGGGLFSGELEAGVDLAPPSPFFCFQNGADVELEWVNNAIYDSLTVLRDGMATVTIEGDDETFIDRNVPCGPHAYQLQATVNGTDLPLLDSNDNQVSFCVLDVICPVESLDCMTDIQSDGQIDVQLGWSSDEEYDEILIRRDGVPIDSISTSSSAYIDVDAPDGVLDYIVTARVEGVTVNSRCQVSIFRIANSPPPGPKVLASVDLALDDAEDGLQNVRGGFANGDNEGTLCGSAEDTRDARRNLGNESQVPDNFFYFKIADPAVRGLTNVIAAAIVFDASELSGTQIFLESLDATSPSSSPVFDRANQTHTLQGTNAWTTLYWNLPGGTLSANEGATADFRIGISNQRKVCVDEVVVLDNSPPPDVPIFLRGDLNGDRQVDNSDVVAKLQFIFGVGPQPGCLDAADFNDDGFLGPDGALFLLNWIYNGSNPPPDPGPSNCGPDPTIDNFPRALCVTGSTCE